MQSLLKLGRKQPEKVSITHFGLVGHEVALFKSMMENAPDLAGHYELCEPNQAGECEIVVVNQDSQLATSWWQNYKKRHPSAVPMFLTNSKTPEENAYCKRPFSPSFLQAAFLDLVSKNPSLAGRAAALNDQA